MKKTLTPWEKSYRNIRQRCWGNPYYKNKGIRRRINIIELKSIWLRDRGFEMTKPSIDRINPDKDYTYENCRYIEYKKNIGMARKPTSKPVTQYSGDFPINSFSSILKASLETKIDHRSISKCANGKRHTAGGFIWKYL